MSRWSAGEIAFNGDGKMAIVFPHAPYKTLCPTASHPLLVHLRYVVRDVPNAQQSCFHEQ